MPRSNSKSNNDGTQPSTSKCIGKFGTTQSPASPVERIAKRNALLMNEIDIKGKRTSSFFMNTLGVVPDFTTYDINEKCDAIAHVLDCDSASLSMEALTVLQKQLENAIADNADHQKRLKGEITYLNTGEYPTDDLNNRPLPVYELCERDSNQFQLISSESPNELGLHSSPEDDIRNPMVTDIPRRFWNWTREYLSHITEDYIVDFRTKIVERFNNESLQKFLQLDDDMKLILSPIATKSPGKFSSSSIAFLTNNNDTLSNAAGDASKPIGGKRSSKRRVLRDSPTLVPAKIRHTIGGNSASKYESYLTQAFAFVLQADDNKKANGLMESNSHHHHHQHYYPNNYNKHHNNSQLIWSNVHQSQQHMSRCGNGGDAPLILRTPPSRRVPLRADATMTTPLNGAHAFVTTTTTRHSNGSSAASSSGSAAASTPLNGHKRHLIESTSNGTTSCSDNFSLKNSYFVSSNEDVDKTELKANFLSDHSFASDDQNLDDVSLEIRKKQKELLMLARVTHPLIDTLYERVQGEYALYEITRRLDLADDKLFDVGKKYETISSFAKEQRRECVNALAARHRALRQLYHYRSGGAASAAASSSATAAAPISRKVSFSDNCL